MEQIIQAASMWWFDKLFRRDDMPPLGRRGERAAERYLRRRGYKIVARGSRCRFGEIDLVAIDGRTVVFVEVKTRRVIDDESPSVAVDDIKQQRLTRSALMFLRAHGLLEQAARFDVVAVTWPDGRRNPTIEYIQNAFEPTDLWQMFS